MRDNQPILLPNQVFFFFNSIFSTWKNGCFPRSRCSCTKWSSYNLIFYYQGPLLHFPHTILPRGSNGESFFFQDHMGKESEDHMSTGKTEDYIGNGPCWTQRSTIPLTCQTAQDGRKYFTFYAEQSISILEYTHAYWSQFIVYKYIRGLIKFTIILLVSTQLVFISL